MHMRFHCIELIRTSVSFDATVPEHQTKNSNSSNAVAVYRTLGVSVHQIYLKYSYCIFYREASASVQTFLIGIPQ